MKSGARRNMRVVVLVGIAGPVGPIRDIVMPAFNPHPILPEVTVRNGKPAGHIRQMFKGEGPVMPLIQVFVSRVELSFSRPIMINQIVFIINQPFIDGQLEDQTGEALGQ